MQDVHESHQLKIVASKGNKHVYTVAIFIPLFKGDFGQKMYCLKALLCVLVDMVAGRERRLM